MLVLSIAGCERRQPERSAPPQPTSGPVIPSTISSSLGPDTEYGIGCGIDAASGTCLCRLQLRRAANVLAGADLGPCTSSAIQAVSASTVPGAGDPLGTGEGWTAWRAGDDADGLLVAARPLRVGPDGEGLLVRVSSTGGAHDAVLVRRGTQLVRADVPGEFFALDVRSSRGAADSVELFARSPGDPSVLWANVASWDDARTALVLDTTHDPPAFLVAIGPYEMDIGSTAAGCLRGGTVVSTSPYAALADGQRAIAAISGDESRAKRALAESHCEGLVDRRVVPIRFREHPFADFTLGDAGRVSLTFGRYDGFGWPVVATQESGVSSAAPLVVAWSANVPRSAPAEHVDLPAGDPLRPLHDTGGWLLGDAGDASLVVQRVRLSTDDVGLVVSSEAGFEHKKRRHYLLAIRDGQLRVLWSRIEAQGPSWTTVIVHARAAVDELLVVSEMYASEQEGPDHIDTARLVYDASTSNVLETPLTCDSSMQLLIVRRFRTLEAAVAAKADECAQPEAAAAAAAVSWLVLPAPGQSAGFVLAQVTSDIRAAARVVEQARRCWADARPTLAPLCSRSSQVRR